MRLPNWKVHPQNMGLTYTSTVAAHRPLEQRRIRVFLPNLSNTTPIKVSSNSSSTATDGPPYILNARSVYPDMLSRKEMAF